MDYIGDFLGFLNLACCAMIFFFFCSLASQPPKGGLLGWLALTGVCLVLSLLNSIGLVYSYVELSELHSLDPATLAAVRFGDRTLSDPETVQALAKTLQGTVFHRTSHGYVAPLQLTLVFKDGHEDTLWIGWGENSLRVCGRIWGSSWQQHEVGTVPGLLDTLTRYKLPGPTL